MIRFVISLVNAAEDEETCLGGNGWGKGVTWTEFWTDWMAERTGTVWWDGDIFSGKPDWDKLHGIPKGRLTPEEQAFLDGPVNEVCSMVDEWEINHKLADMPPEIWDFLKKHKFFWFSREVGPG